MKQTILSLLALATTLTGAADTLKPGYSSVQLLAHDGHTTTVTLTDDMVTTFTDTDIVFADAANTVTMALADLRSFTFTEAVIPDGIATPVVAEAQEIYTADGHRIATLDGAPAGLYIIRSGKSIVKIYHQ